MAGAICSKLAPTAVARRVLTFLVRVHDTSTTTSFSFADARHCRQTYMARQFLPLSPAEVERLKQEEQKKQKLARLQEVIETLQRCFLDVILMFAPHHRLESKSDVWPPNAVAGTDKQLAQSGYKPSAVWR